MKYPVRPGNDCQVTEGVAVISKITEILPAQRLTLART